jgi:prefoldin alpha subunit
LVKEIEGLTRREVEEKAVEMELLRQSMQQLDQQLVALETRKMQIEEVLKGMDELKGGEDVLIPLGPGFFIKGQLKQDKNVIVMIGSNSAMEKTVEDATKVIKDNLEEINKMSDELKAKLLNASERMDEMQEILVKYYGG